MGTGTWTLSGSSTFIGDIDVQQGTLAISGSLNNNGGDFEIESGAGLGMAGGVVSTDTVQVDQGAVLTGSGSIDAMLVNQGTVTVTGGGTLTVNGNFENDGTMTIEGGSALAVNLPADGSASFVNTGLLDIMDSPQTALPNGIVNTGTVLTSALVAVQQVARTATTFSTTIQSYTGHTYQLQEAPDFVTWQNVGAPQAGTGSATCTYRYQCHIERDVLPHRRRPIAPQPINQPMIPLMNRCLSPRILSILLLLPCGALDAVAPSGANFFNVRDYGAVGDGRTLDSPAMDKAIDAAAQAGGGTVLVPAGTYLSGSIHLKSNINLDDRRGRHHSRGAAIDEGL